MSFVGRYIISCGVLNVECPVSLYICRACSCHLYVYFNVVRLSPCLVKVWYVTLCMYMLMYVWEWVYVRIIYCIYAHGCRCADVSMCIP